MQNEIKVFDVHGENTNNYVLAADFLIEKIHNHDMFLAVIAEEAGRRQGTASTLTKGEVRGGGKKPFRQKHTGNARQGSIRNPHYVGGGVVFGPKPGRNYKISLNRLVHRLALRSAYTKKFNDTQLFGLENNLQFDQVSTKTVSAMLNKINENAKHILIVLNDEANNIAFLLSARNLPKVIAKTWDKVSVRDLLFADEVLVQTNAFNKIAEVLK